jgi:cytochrome c oxidase subunit 3
MSVASHTIDTHSHHPEVRHQFDTLEQQHDSYSLGMWAFVVQEVMFFSGLIVTYFMFRYKFPTAFLDGSNHLDLVVSTTNTVVLLSSSLTMALAVHAAQTGHKMKLIQFLVATLVLGSVFLGIKGYEYNQKYVNNLIPGYNFEWTAPPSHVPGAEASHGQEVAENGHAGEVVPVGNALTAAPISYAPFPQQVEVFYGLYFIMTGAHAIHMVIGAVVILILIVLSWKDHFSSNYYVPIEMFGLYWHFVDIVWVFLFPLLYLIDRAAAGGH